MLRWIVHDTLRLQVWGLAQTNRLFGILLSREGLTRYRSRPKSSIKHPYPIQAN
jgi:hypothetical protein